MSNKKKKRSTPAVVSGSTSSVGRVISVFTGVFERKTSIKTAVFFSTRSISVYQLCWDIPGAPRQGRMCGFPFQTELSCPSHHRGSLQKYIPSVEAGEGLGERRQRCFEATGRPFS